MKNKKIISEIDRIKEIMNLIVEAEVVTNYDKAWDYKREGDMFYAKKKNESNWKRLSGNALNSVKRLVFKIKDQSGKSTDSDQDSKNKGIKVGNIAPEQRSQINFNNLSTTSSTSNICKTDSTNCAQFVNDIRPDLEYVGDAWLAYQNENLGKRIHNSFNDLTTDEQKKIKDLWLKIYKSGGDYDNYNTEVKNVVNQLVPGTGKVTDLKLNDVVGIFYPPSTHHGEAFYEGGKKWFKDNEKGEKIIGKTLGTGLGWGMNTHIGTVSVVKDGVPLVFHNVKGTVISEPASNLRIAWIRRK